MISKFINSEVFEKWLKDNEMVNFPLYDVQGWMYRINLKKNFFHKLFCTKKKEEQEEEKKIWLDDNEICFWETLFYKNAKFYFPIMIIISIIMSVF